MKLTLLVVPALLISMFALPAHAQDDSRVAIGAEFTIRTTDRASKSDYAHVQLGPGPLWRFGKAKPGWGFHWGLNWYAVDIDRPVGGAATDLGELHVRPVMAGWGYTRIIHHKVITAALLGGYAIGSMTLSPSAVGAYRDRLGAQSATAEVSNTFVLKPEIGIWHDINRKFGLNVNAGYMIARPDVTVTTSMGTEKRTARADQFILKAGLVYSIY